VVENQKHFRNAQKPSPVNNYGDWGDGEAIAGSVAIWWRGGRAQSRSVQFAFELGEAFFERREQLRHRFKLPRRADFRAFDPLARQHAFSLIAATAAPSWPVSMARWQH
jgi:hypothetical protein